MTEVIKIITSAYYQAASRLLEDFLLSNLACFARIMESGNNEILITSAINVAVLSYDTKNKSWVEATPLNGSPVEGEFIPSSVVLLSDQVYSNARIVARKQTPKQDVLVNCTIGPGLQYKRPTPRFFEWRDSKSSTIFGLNFFSESDAEQFVVNMQNIIAKAGRLKKEPQTAPCGSLENIKYSKFETIPPPGKAIPGNQPIYQKISPILETKRDICDRSSASSFILNPEVQSRPLPPVPANEGVPVLPQFLRQDSLTRTTKKAPPPPTSSKIIISSNRPKTLHPNSQFSPRQSQEVPLPGGIPPPPPPPPIPQPLSTPPTKSPSNIPVVKTKRSQSVGLLDGISAVQLRKLEAPAESTSSKEGNYNDMMSEIADRIKRRKEKENVESSGEPSAPEFKSSSRPNSASKCKIPPPSQLPGRSLKKGLQHTESLNSGTLPSVAEGNVGQGHELLMEKMEELKVDLEKLRSDIYSRLDRFKDDIVNALKAELAGR